MLSKLTLAAAVALPLGLVGLSGAALADYTTHYYIPVQPIPSAHKPAATAPAPMVRHAAMSCAAAERKLRAEGYGNVKARDCDDRTYTFHATKNGHLVVLRVNSHNGHMWRA